MNINNTFSDKFIETIKEFKKSSDEYDYKNSLEYRFNLFLQNFEASWNINLHEVDNSGMYELVINIPLKKDVENEMIKLLNTIGFRNVERGKMEKKYDYYFENGKGSKTFFYIIKNM